ncbi:AraC family transcriptional regulator [Aliiruegeria haliotis]|nr:AraC family transcriptional regulator [Aliiruegeria haliotis]
MCETLPGGQDRAYDPAMQQERTDKFVLNPGWRILLSEMGLPIADTLRAAQLPPTLLDNLPTALDADSYFRFWRALAESSGDREIPLLMTQALDVEVFSPPLYAAVCSHNLRQAARRVARYKALTGPITIDAGDDPSRLRLVWQWPPTLQPPLALLMSEILFWVYLVRKCTRVLVNPVEISVPELPHSLPQYLDFIGAPIRRADDVSVIFASRDADMVFVSGNDAIWSAFEPKLKQDLEALEASHSTSGRVRVALMRAIPADTASAAQIAETLALTPRTLQRRLSEEGTSFNQLLNATRAELARHYLTACNLPLAEISFLLGFKEPSSFNRAFLRWTGTTPEQFRQQAGKSL